MISISDTTARRRSPALRGFLAFLGFALLVTILSLPSWSQEGDASGAAPSVEQLQKQLDAAQRDAARQAKHLRNYLFPAYVIIWLLLFGYIRFVARKERDLAQQVEDLRARVEKGE